MIIESQKENPDTQKNVAKIKATKSGPYLVLGKIPLQKLIIIAYSGETATEWQQSIKYTPQEKYALCRCGHSKKKPFCDNNHYPEAETVENVNKEKEHY